MYHSLKGKMPERVEHDGPTSVSYKCPLCNIQATLLLGQKNTFIFCVDNDRTTQESSPQVCFCNKSVDWILMSFMCTTLTNRCSVSGILFFFFFGCVATSEWMRGEVNGCIVIVLTWPSISDLLLYTVSSSWKEPLRQALQARLSGCLSNVTQDESICRGKYQTESEDDPSVDFRQDIFKGNFPACRSLMQACFN